jgi:O-antigen/teichoic acid export membrane protein
MLYKIIETIVTKGFTSFCNLLILLITTNYLGAEGRGEMAIVILGISIVAIFQNIFSGSAITYFTPKYEAKKLIFIATMWNLIVSFSFPSVLIFMDLFPENYKWDLLFLSFLVGGIAVIQNLLLGKEAVKKQNIIEVVKAFSTVLFLIVTFAFFENHTLQSVIISLYGAYIIGVITAVFLLIPELKKEKIIPVTLPIFPQFFSIGLQMQLTNISQMINYRFCFYLVEKKLGLSALGIFSVATSLIEMVWIVCKSISSVHYSKFVNLKNKSQRVVLTQKLSRVTLVLTLFLLIVLLFIPNNVFEWIFGKEFDNLRPILLSMSPGAIALAVYTIINHHFSGIRKHTTNLKASILGNIFTIIVGIVFITPFGLVGAGIATSVGYFMMFAYLFFKFNRKYNVPFFWLSFNPTTIKRSFQLNEF